MLMATRAVTLSDKYIVSWYFTIIIIPCNKFVSNMIVVYKLVQWIISVIVQKQKMHSKMEMNLLVAFLNIHTFTILSGNVCG
jgi:hypothetical protein